MIAMMERSLIRMSTLTMTTPTFFTLIMQTSSKLERVSYQMDKNINKLIATCRYHLSLQMSQLEDQEVRVLYQWVIKVMWALPRMLHIVSLQEVCQPISKLISKLLEEEEDPEASILMPKIQCILLLLNLLQLKQKRKEKILKK